MIRGFVGYLFREHTVVMEKSDIKNNPPDEDFRQISIYIDEKHIRQWNKELEMATELEGQQETEY